MNGYDLHRQWFDFAFENSDIVSGNHSGVYLWAVELNNRLGWVKKFSFPASQAMAANGIKSYNTYKKVYNDLVDWGFFEVVQESKNQWTACIIALSKIDKALDKSLDKAVVTHLTKQIESTCQSTDSIIKPQTSKPQTTNYPPIPPDGGGSADEVVVDETEVEASDEKEKKVAPKKEKSEPPAIEEFVAYGLANITGVTSYRSDLWESVLRRKYTAWLESGWKTGGKKPKPIQVWKTTLLNSLSYLERDVSIMISSQPTMSKLEHNLSVGARVWGIN